MFDTGTVVAYPTDTSYGLGVRVDDPVGMGLLYQIKNRPATKWLTIMVQDWDMLDHYAHVPADMPRDFFVSSPKTALLCPKPTLPHSQYYPADKVGFRVCVVPAVAEHIQVPITATSANLSGQPSIFDPLDIQRSFGDRVQIIDGGILPPCDPSQIWDLTVDPWVRVR